MNSVRKLPALLFLLMIGLISALTVSCEKEPDSEDESGNDTIVIDTSSHFNLPSGWSKAGELNANGMIWSVTSDKSGNIYAAGYFTNSAGYNYVAKWDGSSWSDIGLNANNSIYALTVDFSGNLYAVGYFTDGVTPGGGETYVAKWDGTAWSNVGSSYNNLLLTADDQGNVYNGASRWNGTVWEPFTILTSQTYGSVLALETTASGEFQYAAGSFAHYDGSRYVAKWDGSSWSELGNLNVNSDINVLATDAQGNVYAAGNFTNGNLPSTGYHYVAKWDGTSWEELGTLNANGSISYLAIDPVTNDVYASGYFTNSDGKYYVAKWDGASWSDLGNMSLAPAPIHVTDAGKLYSVIPREDGKFFWVVVHD